jgi:hypothetical protein
MLKGGEAEQKRSLTQKIFIIALKERAWLNFSVFRESFLFSRWVGIG